MTKLSVEKLNQLKNEKCLTNKRISELSEIPLVTIDRLFSGRNLNPTVNILQKIAKVLDCTLDDFFEYDDEKYYKNAQTQKLAQELYENTEMKILFDASKELEVSDLNAVIEIVKRMKKTKS